MLRFPRDFVDDPKADQIVKQYLHQRLVSLMQDVIQEKVAMNGGTSGKNAEKEFEERLFPYFPDHFNPTLRPVVFFGLYELLISEEEQVPTLIMEYVMNALLEIHADSYEALQEAGLIKQMPEREYVLEKLRDMYEGYEEEDMPSADQVLAGFEDPREYLEYYFWDVDFRMLDLYTEQDLAESELNKRFGIMDEGTYTRKFIIPADWMK